MEQDSDRIDTIETIPTKETVNQDGIKEEDNTKPPSSNKGNNDVIEVKSNGILNEKEINSNNKDEFCEVTLDEVDPFTNHVNVSKCQMLQIVLMSVTIAPIRVLCCIILLLLMWLLARVGLLCINDETLKTVPHSGWRKSLQQMLYGIGKAVVFCCGFHNVSIVGEKCSYEDAAILISVPHSTIMDIIGIVYSHAVPVSKESVTNIPIIGVIGRFLQVIWVSRDSKDSRKIVGDTINTRAEMKTRRKSLLKRSSQRLKSSLSRDRSVDSAKSVKSKIEVEEDETASWPQTILFPEGTVTNGKAIIKFKSGAFYPGVPVQPMLLRPRAVKDSSSPSGYRIKGMDTLTWTMYQNWSPLKCMWFTLCQFHSNFVVEYLPLYRPTQDERRDPKLYASNVRIKVAHQLSVPLADVSMEDRFYKKNKDNLSENEGDVQETNTGEKEIEVFEINESTKENNNSDLTDSSKVPNNKKSESPLLGPTSNPSINFSGTINYI